MDSFRSASRASRKAAHPLLHSSFSRRNRVAGLRREERRLRAAEDAAQHVSHAGAGHGINPSVTASPCHLPLHKGDIQGARRQKTLAPFRRRASTPSPYSLPPSSLSRRTRCAGLRREERRLRAAKKGFPLRGKLSPKPTDEGNNPPHGHTKQETATNCGGFLFL